MIIDSSLQIAAGISVVSGTGTTLIGSQIDTWGDVGFDIPRLSLVIVANSPIITGGSAGTLQFALASDTSAAISTTTSQVLMYTPQFVTGSTPIPAGAILFVCRLPLSVGVLPVARRFIGLLQITGTAAVTGGGINSFLTEDAGRWAANAQAAN
ncbi:hypothetical protein [Rhodopila sp.]|uniref:hypothetical protein n=1 Tax=Rhodopila sp. TaxID=2480087 RepID=UPI003D0FEAB8